MRKILFLSTLSLRRATNYVNTTRTRNHHFYPRSPCGERRCISRKQPVQAAFLSTLSLRRATGASRASSQSRRHFYPRSPCGERRDSGGNMAGWYDISIHALLAESDGESPGGYVRHDGISIHALLAESDRHWQTGHSLTRQFLSTLSLRRATLLCRFLRFWGQFLSTLSLRRATRPGCPPCLWRGISIHALLAESDRPGCPPCLWRGISIHALLAESDPQLPGVAGPGLAHFYPRSPCGERPGQNPAAYKPDRNFYPRSPCGERRQVSVTQ